MSESINLRKKICLLGDPAVGKTSIIAKYVHNQFNDSYISTIGTEVTKKDISIEYHDIELGKINYEMNLAIWDIIGQKEYRSLISRFFKNANGALLVCDLTRKKTLDNLTDWATSLFGAVGKVPIVIVCNKYDLIDQKDFELEEVIEFSSKYGAAWITTSAKNGENVELAFTKLGESIIKNSLYFERMKSLIDVLDAIIVDFCEVYGGLEVGMPVFREEFMSIPGANLMDPTKELIEELIKILTKITEEEKGKEISDAQQTRFYNWLRKVV